MDSCTWPNFKLNQNWWYGDKLSYLWYIYISNKNVRWYASNGTVLCFDLLAEVIRIWNVLGEVARERIQAYLIIFFGHHPLNPVGNNFQVQVQVLFTWFTNLQKNAHICTQINLQWILSMINHSVLPLMTTPQPQTHWTGGRFKNTYELLNLRALKISKLHKNHIFQCMGKIFCVEFQRVPLKFHTKYLTHTLKDVDFIHIWKFKSS